MNHKELPRCFPNWAGSSQTEQMVSQSHWRNQGVASRCHGPPYAWLHQAIFYAYKARLWIILEKIVYLASSNKRLVCLAPLNIQSWFRPCPERFTCQPFSIKTARQLLLFVFKLGHALLSCCGENRDCLGVARWQPNRITRRTHITRGM